MRGSISMSDSPLALRMMAAKFAQLARNAHSVLRRKLQVENDEIHHALAERLMHRATIGDPCDAQLALAQIVGQELSDRGVVIDDEDMGRSTHLSGSSGASSLRNAATTAGCGWRMTRSCAGVEAGRPG